MCFGWSILLFTILEYNFIGWILPLCSAWGDYGLRCSSPCSNAERCCHTMIHVFNLLRLMDNNNHSVSPGHDAEAEVNIRGILIFLVILTATVVMVQLAAGRLIGCFENAAAKRDERATSQREEASIAGS